MASSATRDGSSFIGADGHLRNDPEAVALVHHRARAEPALRGLADLEFFGAEWGSSGLHFAGKWRASGADVILKVGVSPAQRWWTETIAKEDPSLAPMLFASGSRLGDIDLGWILAERLPGGLHPGWCGLEFGMLMAAGARFHRLARNHPTGPHSVVTVDDVAGWIRSAMVRGAPGPAASMLDRLDQDWTFVCDVCPPEICHGDLHMANVLMRTPAPQLSDAVLIDFEPSLMPWAFEAAYCQVLNSDPDRVGWQGLVPLMGVRRAALGLQTISGTDLKRVEAIALGWYALRMWSILGPDTDPSWRLPSVWRAATDSYVTQAIRS
ncbi:aminoglycoside phosphotransferase/kinase family protein [Microlunatus parietis]|uniref:Aminoglycoside phosphotransferase domain-containing protein n=1 Tax=Microlunatus parietis TaxID=682979 RepID=A0A7Y9I339_9ACTN|nr:phosphotransferase [Microlunatus parietis]NYE69252.1 hypothetical protein [Microlunatus parietis]